MNLNLRGSLITYEKLGNGPATDLLIISLSANDILGHKVGPDSPEMQAMALATDRQLAGFFEFLGHQIGLANVWIALSADHGIAPLPKVAAGLHLPAVNIPADKIRAQVNSALSTRLSHPAEYVKQFDYPVAWLNPDAFAAVKVNEQDAERDVGDALKQAGMRSYYTRSQLERGDAPNTELGLKYLHSYSPLAGWYVLGVPPPFAIGFVGGTDHAISLHLRHARAARVLWSSVPGGNLSHPRRAGRSGGDAGFTAGDQRAFPLDWTGSDRDADSCASGRKFFERRAGSQLTRGRRTELQARVPRPHRSSTDQENRHGENHRASTGRVAMTAPGPAARS